MSTEYTPTADFVFILGMHRSGTSCLTGSLERCGVFLGNVSRSNRFNDKGNHELKAVVRLQEQVLVANGGGWHEPPAHITVSTQHKQAFKGIIKQLAQYCPCGIKDPRLLLLLDTWVELVPSYTMVGTFRHPHAVVQSLRERNHLSEEHAYSLWLLYNTELVRWHKRYQFPLIEFDVSDPETYQRTIAAIALMLGLKLDMEQMKTFIAPDLDHYKSVVRSIPAKCRDLYEYLKQQKVTP